MNVIAFKRLYIIIALLSLNFLIGCAGMEFAPKKGIWYYPKELPGAEQAIQNAHKAGKDKECPKEFKAAKNMKDDAYNTYWSCKTKEAIDLAKEATKKAKALCPSKKAAKVIDRMTLMVHFDFDKSDIKENDKPELKKAIDFIKKYPNSKVNIEGHTDHTGTEEYNKGLSIRRAEAVKQYLVKEGKIDAKRLKAVGYGKSKPIATNKTKEGRAKNRRVEILILAE